MTKRKSDPFAGREAQNYDNPIPSREFILDYLSASDQLLTHQELAEALELEDEDSVEALRRRLKAMQRDGQIMRGRRGRYGIIDKMDLICGTVDAHRDGFGFLQPDDHSSSLFISAYQMRALFHGDKVLVCLVDSGDQRGRKEAKVVEITERHTKTVAGRLSITAGLAHVVPDDKRLSSDLIIPKDALSGATDGQIVVAEIVQYPTIKSQGVGKITEILGEHMAPGMEIDLAIRSHALPHVFPDDALAQASAFSDVVKEDEFGSRRDLRDLPFVTIDGEDARDFDDAVYAKQQGEAGWCLYVAIADVSHYVKPGSPLDVEAQLRGNSVYFPSNVIPMLPENLSNGLCSLNPHVDRLVLVCKMSIDNKSGVGKYEFFEAVIHSHHRFTYSKVTELLTTPDKAEKEYHAILPMLQILHDVQKTLSKRRKINGAMDFDSSDTKIVFGEGRKIKEIVPVEYTLSNRIIEECMLAANISAADFINKSKVPGIYRVHNAPNEDSVKVLRETLAKLGLELGGGKKPEPKYFSRVLTAAKKRPDRRLINMLVLRSLNQAVYDVELGDGHFGLAFDAYTHFTSPIRRYPDLLVHRIIRALANKNKDALPPKPALQEAASNCSMTERRADQATRDAVEWLKCEFMLDKVGQEFSGTISGVAGFGLFVQLDDVYVEGLVHISSLGNDYYHFDADTLTLIGRHSGLKYALGDQVKIQVARVDLDERHIDFALLDVQDAPDMKGKKPKTGTKPKGRKKAATKKKSATKKKAAPNKKAGAKEKAKAKKKVKKKAAKRKSASGK